MMMEKKIIAKQVGKLYVSTTEFITLKPCVILCTAYDKVKPTWGKYITMSGIVVKNDDPTSSLPVGTFSDTWNANIFQEYIGTVTLNNIDWKPTVEIGSSPG